MASPDPVHCHLFAGTGLHVGREACEEVGVGGAGWRQGFLVSVGSSGALEGREDKERKEGGLEGSLRFKAQTGSPKAPRRRCSSAGRQAPGG